MEERYAIAAFRSRTQVLRLEADARRVGIEGTVVSTPRAAALGCGLSLKVAHKDLPALQKLIERNRYQTLIGLYSVDTSTGRARLQVYSH